MVANGVAGAYAHIRLEKHLMIEVFGSKSMELKWIRRRRRISTSPQLQKEKEKDKLLTPLFPVYISTDLRHVDPQHLRHLCATCNHSFHRFPNLRPEPEPVDIHKLCIALSHSAVLVSVFCKPYHVVPDDAFAASSSSVMAVTDFFTPVSPSCDQLVIPSLRGMGIGKMIVKKIVKMLTSRDIYDIAALCSEDERLFFKACGFGGDILGSTTMMYTRTASTTTQEGEQTVTRAGRKLLLVPPLMERP